VLFVQLRNLMKCLFQLTISNCDCMTVSTSGCTVAMSRECTVAMSRGCTVAMSRGCTVAMSRGARWPCPAPRLWRTHKGRVPLASSSLTARQAARLIQRTQANTPTQRSARHRLTPIASCLLTEHPAAFSYLHLHSSLIPSSINPSGDLPDARTPLLGNARKPK